MKQCIFYLPYKLEEHGAGARMMRPRKMAQAFRDIGYEVAMISGVSSSRRKQIHDVKKRIAAGEKFDFLYMEASTEPTLLTDPGHLPTHPFLDYGFLEYVRKHESIPPVKEFRLSDADYEDFIAFAKGKEFDYRSSAKTYFDRAKEELKLDGLDEAMKPQLDALEQVLNMEKEDFLRLKKDEIVPFLEEEIAVRYYFQEAGVEVRIRYDDALRQAIAAERIKQY